MRWLFVPAVFILLTACSAITVLSEKPKLEVTGVRVKEIGFTGATILVASTIENTSSKPIRIESIGYSMKINTSHLADGALKDSVGLQGREKKEIEIPIRFSYKDIAASFNSIIKDKKFDYDFSGKAKVGLIHIPFSKKGSLEVGL